MERNNYTYFGGVKGNQLRMLIVLFILCAIVGTKKQLRQPLEEIAQQVYLGEISVMDAVSTFCDEIMGNE